MSSTKVVKVSPTPCMIEHCAPRFPPRGCETMKLTLGVKAEDFIS